MTLQKMKSMFAKYFVISKIVALILASVAAVESWTTTSPSSSEEFCSRYEQRLGLEFSLQEGEPCANKLRLLTETHLEKVPFDNLRLHGAANAPVSMDPPILAHQLIDRQRGGLCFELNALFAELLGHLGYNVIFVHGKMIQATSKEVPHLALLVNDANGKTWYADVGMGEPPLHPLEFVLEKTQETPDGMKSRFVENGDSLELEWYLPDKGAWETRFQFSRQNVERDIRRNPRPADFEPAFLEVLDVGSSFRRKPVVCKLTRTEKVTLAGNRLKRSRNRFKADAEETTYEMDTIDEIRYVLQDEFGIPLDETLGLTVPDVETKRRALAYH